MALMRCAESTPQQHTTRTTILTLVAPQPWLINQLTILTSANPISRSPRGPSKCAMGSVDAAIRACWYESSRGWVPGGWLARGHKPGSSSPRAHSQGLRSACMLRRYARHCPSLALLSGRYQPSYRPFDISSITALESTSVLPSDLPSVDCLPATAIQRHSHPTQHSFHAPTANPASCQTHVDFHLSSSGARHE